MALYASRNSHVQPRDKPCFRSRFFYPSNAQDSLQQFGTSPHLVSLNKPDMRPCLYRVRATLEVACLHQVPRASGSQAPIDLTGSDSLPPRGTRARGRARAPALEAVDSSDEAPESSDDVVVLHSQPPAPTSSANLTRTAKRKRTVLPPPSTPHLARSQGQSTPPTWNHTAAGAVRWG